MSTGGDKNRQIPQPKTPAVTQKTLYKGTEVYIISKAILADDVSIPARSDGHRATIKYRSTETKSKYRQVQVPVDFIVEANSVEGRKIGWEAPPVRRPQDAAGGADSQGGLLNGEEGAEGSASS